MSILEGQRARQFRDKARGAELRWFGYIQRDEEYVGKRTLEMDPLGRRKRRRPERKFMEAVKCM